MKYVGLNVDENRIAVAVAGDGHRAEGRKHDEMANTLAALTKLLVKLGRPGLELPICYEAGFGLYGHSAPGGWFSS